MPVPRTQLRLSAMSLYIFVHNFQMHFSQTDFIMNVGSIALIKKKQNRGSPYSAFVMLRSTLVWPASPPDFIISEGGPCTGGTRGGDTTWLGTKLVQCFIVCSLCFIVFHCVSLCFMSFIEFHCVSWCLIVFHGVSLCFIELHCVSLCFIVFHCVSLRCIVCRCVSLCFTVFHCFPLCFIVLHCVSLCFIEFHCVPLCLIVVHCV